MARGIIRAKNLEDAKRKFIRKYGREAVKLSTVRFKRKNIHGRFYEAVIDWRKVRKLNLKYL